MRSSGGALKRSWQSIRWRVAKSLSAASGQACSRAKVHTCLAALPLALATFACSPATVCGQEEPLTTVRQILSLSSTFEEKPRPVHLHAIETYYDTVAPNLFV